MKKEEPLKKKEEPQPKKEATIDIDDLLGLGSTVQSQQVQQQVNVLESVDFGGPQQHSFGGQPHFGFGQTQQEEEEESSGAGWATAFASQPTYSLGFVTAKPKEVVSLQTKG